MSKRVFVHVFLPLVAGLVIYLVFREDTWVHRFLGIKNSIINPENSSGFVKALIYSGTDFLWAYSFTSAMLLWRSKPPKSDKLFAGLILFVVLLSEIVQIALRNSFRFDIQDLAAAFLGFLLSFFIINSTWLKRKI